MLGCCSGCYHSQVQPDSIQKLVALVTNQHCMLIQSSLGGENGPIVLYYFVINNYVHS